MMKREAKHKNSKLTDETDLGEIRLLTANDPVRRVWRAGLFMSGRAARRHFASLFKNLPHTSDIDEIELHIVIERRKKKGGAR